MFGFVADGLTVATTVLFPIFASYKALHTSDPALLAPWLMYFVTLSLVTAVESTFDFILSWIPFYAWIRFFVHLYLILPGSQGASSLYLQYIEPFLYRNEREIDDFITDTHNRAKAAGLNFVQQGIEWIKVHVLGFAPQKAAPPPTAGQTYAQNFMSRFAVPSARGGGGDNLSNLVSQALSGASALYSGAQVGAGAQAENLSRSSTLVPESIRNNEDRLSYVSSQRERLESLLQAFDREQSNLRTAQESGSRYYGDDKKRGLYRNKSEDEFDRVERDEFTQGTSGSGHPPYPVTPPAFLNRRTSSGWMPWNWRQSQAGSHETEDPRDEDLAYGSASARERERDRHDSMQSRAKSSGFDFGDR